MSGKKGILGGMGEIMKMLSNPEAAGEAVKEKVPNILAAIMANLAKECGAKENSSTAVLLFRGDTGQQEVLMARVTVIDEFGDFAEELGTVTVAEAMAKLSSDEILQMLG